jgi:hypothetical protein
MITFGLLAVFLFILSILHALGAIRVDQWREAGYNQNLRNRYSLVPQKCEEPEEWEPDSDATESDFDTDTTESNPSIPSTPSLPSRRLDPDRRNNILVKKIYWDALAQIEMENMFQRLRDDSSFHTQSRETIHTNQTTQN